MNYNLSQIDKEINALLPAKYEYDDIVVHRSLSGVVIADKRPNSSMRKSTSTDMQSSLLINLTCVSPIIRKLREKYFNDSANQQNLRLTTNKKKILLKTRPKKFSAKQEMRLQDLRLQRDPISASLKSQIHDSSVRLRQSRIGKSRQGSSEIVVFDSQEALSFDSNGKKKNVIWDNIKNRERNKPLEEKLRFFNESPRTGHRRVLTQHTPWDNPRLLSLPDTPENDKNYPKYNTANNNEISNKTGKDLSFLLEAPLLDKEDNTLKVQAIFDEQRKLRAAQIKNPSRRNHINKPQSQPGNTNPTKPLQQKFNRLRIGRTYTSQPKRSQDLIAEFFS